jgi:hypothetical protein
MTKEEAHKIIQGLERQVIDLTKKATALNERLELLEAQTETIPGKPVIVDPDDQDDQDKKEKDFFDDL